MNRTVEDIDREIERETGKRDQHLTHPKGHPMLALFHQFKIDKLVEEKHSLLEASK